MTDPTIEFATHLIMDVARRSKGLSTYLLAKTSDLPPDPLDAHAVLAARWPRLSVEERQNAIRSAAAVLRGTAEDCMRESAILDALMETGGNG